jgi:hypothetical protein
MGLDGEHVIDTQITVYSCSRRALCRSIPSLAMWYPSYRTQVSTVQVIKVDTHFLKDGHVYINGCPD